MDTTVFDKDDSALWNGVHGRVRRGRRHVAQNSRRPGRHYGTSLPSLLRWVSIRPWTDWPLIVLTRGLASSWCWLKYRTQHICQLEPPAVMAFMLVRKAAAAFR